MNPLISIIIPTYNRQDLLPRALDSIFRQSYNHWEVIVVDNFSTDNTKDLLSEIKDKRINVYEFKNFGVIGASRNLAISHAQGEYLAFLDSDDWWDPTKLEDCMKYMTSYDADLIYHECYIMGNGKNSSTHARELTRKPYQDLLCNGNTLVTSSVVVKKSSVMDVNGFSEDPKKAGWEDYDLWVRLAKSGSHLKFCKKKLGFYWMGKDKFDNPDRILKNLDSMSRSILKEFKKESGIYPWWPKYTGGIANFNKGNFVESRKLFSGVLKSNAPLYSKFKAAYYLLKILFS